jgi:hypothetical protein
MTQTEYLSWIEFYRLYPFDDLHRYHRPAALVASRSGGNPQQYIDWLQPEPGVASGAWSAADVATFRALGVRVPVT